MQHRVYCSQSFCMGPEYKYKVCKLRDYILLLEVLESSLIIIRLDITQLYSLLLKLNFFVVPCLNCTKGGEMITGVENIF